MPEADADDARLYGSDTAGSHPAAAWLLMLAGVISLGAVVPSGGTSGRRRSRVCGCAALLGTIVGMYLALQLFPAQRLLQVGLSNHCLLAIGCVQVVLPCPETVACSDSAVGRVVTTLLAGLAAGCVQVVSLQHPENPVLHTGSYPA